MSQWRLLFLATLLAFGAVQTRADEPAPSEQETANLHFQATTISQFHPSFNSPYQGPNSLVGTSEFKTSLTSTLFFGYRVLPQTTIFANPEITAGEGFSAAHGVAGFPNGEIYRVDTPSAKLYPARLFVQQVIGFGGGKE